MVKHLNDGRLPPDPGEMSENFLLKIPVNIENTAIKKMSDISAAAYSFRQAHVFQGLVETNHKTPSYLKDNEFIGKHAIDIFSLLTRE